jgi:putative membrane protein
MSQSSEHAAESVLDAAARARIDAAIAAAERGTGAEIVVAIARKSGRYLHVVYETGLVGALVALAVYSAVYWFRFANWPVAAVDVFLGVAALGFVAGALAARSDSVARFFAGENVMLDACERTARDVFAAHDVRRTRERNGVLLYVGLFEHMVFVRGDEAVTAALPEGAYRETVEAVIAKLRVGRIEEGVIEGVERLGKLLAPAFPRRADDVNELPDRAYFVS